MPATLSVSSLEHALKKAASTRSAIPGIASSLPLPTYIKDGIREFAPASEMLQSERLRCTSSERALALPIIASPASGLGRLAKLRSVSRGSVASPTPLIAVKPLRPSARCSSLSSGQPWASACSSVSVQQGVRFVTLGSSACNPKRSRCSRGKQRAASRIAYGPEMGSTMEQSAGHVLAMALIASSGKGSVHSIDSSGAFDGNAREKEMMRDRVTVLPSMRRERSRHSFAIWRQASAVRSRQRSMRSVCTRGKCVASSIGPTSVQPERVRIVSDDEMSSSPLNALRSSPWSSR